MRKKYWDQYEQQDKVQVYICNIIHNEWKIRNFASQKNTDTYAVNPDVSPCLTHSTESCHVSTDCADYCSHITLPGYEQFEAPYLLRYIDNTATSNLDMYSVSIL